MSTEGVFEFVNGLPTSADPLDHEVTFGGVAGIDQVFHDFTETLTDAAVQDSGSGAVPYDPPSETVTVSGSRTIQRNLDAFRMKRIHLRIDEGRAACVESDADDAIILTYRRPGAPGAGGAGPGWEPLPSAETELSGE